MRSSGRSKAAADGKEGKKEKEREKQQQNEKNDNDMKREREVLVVESSSSDSEEEEEEAKSSKNSNQNSNLVPKEEEEGETEEEEEKYDIKRNKNLSNGVAVSGRFPAHRIKRMIRSERDFRTTGEAIFLINKATGIPSLPVRFLHSESGTQSLINMEKFLESLTEDAYACSRQDRKKSMHYKHLSSVVSKGKRYDFLSDFVPEKIKADDALEERRLAGA